MDGRRKVKQSTQKGSASATKKVKKETKTEVKKTGVKKDSLKKKAEEKKLYSLVDLLIHYDQNGS